MVKGLMGAMVLAVVVSPALAQDKFDPMRQHFEQMGERLVQSMKNVVGLPGMDTNTFLMLAVAAMVLVVVVLAVIFRKLQYRDLVKTEERQMLARQDAERRIAARQNKGHSYRR